VIVPVWMSSAIGASSVVPVRGPTQPAASHTPGG
jgi:hypothetical protein